MTKAIIKNKCPKCESLMEVREHSIITEEMLEKEYWFSEWYYCPNCRHLQHFEDKKIHISTYLVNNYNKNI